MKPCRVTKCFGYGYEVLIDGKLEMSLCPSHAVKVREAGMLVEDLRGNQPWLHSVSSQADGDSA